MKDAKAKAPESLYAYQCVLRAYEYVGIRAPEEHAQLRTCLERAIEEEPTDSRLVTLRGDASLAMGDLEAAEASYKRAIEIDPENVTTYSQLAAFYLRTGRLDEGIHAYKRSVGCAPTMRASTTFSV